MQCRHVKVPGRPHTQHRLARRHPRCSRCGRCQLQPHITTHTHERHGQVSLWTEAPPLSLWTSQRLCTLRDLGRRVGQLWLEAVLSCSPWGSALLVVGAERLHLRAHLIGRQADAHAEACELPDPLHTGKRTAFESRPGMCMCMCMCMCRCTHGLWSDLPCPTPKGRLPELACAPAG